MGYSASKYLKQKKQARDLIVNEGMLQKEAAKIVGVSENTMSEWVALYGWTASEEQALKKLDNATILDGFAAYLRENDQSCYEQVLERLKTYLTSKK